MKFRDHFPLLTLCVVFLVALCLRLYNLDQSPKGALIDEAHFGFLAKSLLLTGQDEHGKSWPIVFTGFGDQKLPAYAYALIPFVKFFDLSVLTIRLPSALAGAVSVVLIYILARKAGFQQWSAIVGAGLMAVSPWPFFLSRFGFESNLALFFWILGLIGLVCEFRTQPKNASRFWWIWPVGTGVALALTWYSYIAYRPVSVGVLALLTVLAVVNRRQLLKNLAIVWISMILCVLPLFHPSVSAANTARLGQVGILSDDLNVAVIDEYRTFCNMRLPLSVCSVIWNKGTYAIQAVGSRYLHTFSPEFLATSGEANETFLNVKGFGQFSIIVYPLFLLGLAELLLLRKKLRLTEWLVLGGLLLAPIPTIMAGEPQKVRISALLPFMILLALYGLHRLAVWLGEIDILYLPPRLVKWAVGLAMSGIFLTSTSSYFVDFFTVHMIKNDYMYQSYLTSLFPKLKAEFGDHQLLVKPFFSDPTMFYAFHTHMDPAAYQRQAVLGNLEDSGFQHTVAIDQMKVWDSGFESAACEAVRTNTPTLYITNERGPADIAVPVTEGKSENGAMTYAYVYDALLSGKLSVMNCNDIPMTRRLEIAKEVTDIGLREKLFGSGQ